MNLIVSYLTCR